MPYSPLSIKSLIFKSFLLYLEGQLAWQPDYLYILFIPTFLKTSKPRDDPYEKPYGYPIESRRAKVERSSNSKKLRPYKTLSKTAV